MELKSTLASESTTVNLLVYGAAGAGKTTLIKSLPKPIVLSAESGLISIADCDIPYITIDSVEKLMEAYKFIRTNTDYETVCIDSISEIAEICLENEKKVLGKDGKPRNPMQTYGALGERMIKIIKAFRDLDKNVYMSAKLDKMQDEMGRILYAPSMPGKMTSTEMPYIFDEVLALRVEKNQEGQTVRVLQCQPDGLWLAKDRSGKLGDWEQPDLGEIINKVRGK